MKTAPKIAFCLEVSAAPCSIVLFGATGDLARRKLIPSLFRLHQSGLLHADSCVTGCGRSGHDHASFRQLAADALPAAPPVARDAFLARLFYIRAEPSAPATFADLARHLDALDGCDTPAPRNRLHYLAIPPAAYPDTVAGLASAGLLTETAPPAWRHILFEKPFGTDTASAVALDAFLHRHLREGQIFRVDHYLAKETVQNILVLRFANRILQPLWNAGHIDHIQITADETLGVENRAAYYDRTGLLRDMFQNHLLQLLALTAMEPPASLDADAIHASKSVLIHAIRPFTPDAIRRDIIRAQYTGYRGEPGIAPASATETFVALKLAIDTPRWRGVPFYIRSGKRLPARASAITIVFKPASHPLFQTCDPDTLTLAIQPDEGMSLRLQAKSPGPKLCMGQLPLTFDYADLDTASQPVPDAYARIILDAMLNDRTLFVRSDIITASWNLFTPVLEAWQRDPAAHPLHTYPPASGIPPAAVHLLTRDRRHWLSD